MAPRLMYTAAMGKPVCAIVGVGPGNGTAYARRFAAEGYAVALLARNAEFLTELEADLEGATGFACDVTHAGAVASAFTAIEEHLGPVEVLVYNAGSGVFSNVEETTPEAMESSWQVNTLGLLLCAQQVIPSMKERGSGAIVVTGATASLRGGANFAAFASAKAAQRSLAQSMARHLWPQGIHVSLVIVDGMVDMPRVREMMPDVPADRLLNPNDIAQSVFFLSQQPRSAWTFELDARPFKEKW